MNRVLTDADALADLNGTPRPEQPEESIEDVKQAYALLFKESATLWADAQRYRWLRGTHPIEWPITLHADAILAPNYFDAAIDAALKEAQ